MDGNSNTCRLCLLGNAVVRIFKNRNRNILEMIKKCCQFEILENDNLPQNLCLKCLNTLNICHEFILQCVENNEKLLLQEQNKVKTEFVKIEQEYLIKCEFDNELDVTDKKPNNSLETYYDNEDAVNDNLDDADDIKPIVYSKGTKKRHTKEKKTNVSTKVPSKQLAKKSDKLLIELRGEKTDKILCDLCGKAIKRDNMNEHKRTHSTERKFNCELCSSSFKVRAYLMRHIKYVHTDSTATCDICKKVYNNTNALKVHLEKVHVAERKYACEVCPKKFKVKNFLQLHMRTHTQEKPFQCKFCESTFSLKKTKIEHERLHMGITPYKCPTCPKAFTQLSNMKSHFKHNHKDTVFSEVYRPGPRGTKILIQDKEVVRKSGTVDADSHKES